MQLQVSGLAGEGNLGSRDMNVFITKTHWPAESPFGAVKFHANKAFCIVRNQCDSTYSGSYLTQTTSHSAVFNEDPRDFPEFYDEFMNFSARHVRYQYEELVEGECKKTIPTYYTRYEDLLINPKPELEGLFAFLLDVEDIKGTVVEKRIHDSCSKGTESKSVYTLKTTSKNPCKNLDKYTPQTLNMWKDKIRPFNYYFGYCNHPTVEHHTPIFEYGDDVNNVPHDKEMLDKMFMGFRQSNLENIKKCASRKEGEPAPRFDFNESFRERFKPTTLPNIATQLTIKAKKF